MTVHSSWLACVAAFSATLPQLSQASLDSDPYLADPSFNGGVIIEDRFAATTTDNHQIAQKIARLGNGDVVVAGLVPAAFAPNQPDGYFNLGLVRYGADGARVPWNNPTPAFSYFNNMYIDYPNTSTAQFTHVRDLVAADGRLYVLLDYAFSASDADVVIAVFDQDGALLDVESAFDTTLTESGAGLVTYDDGAAEKLIAVATYVNGSTQSIITLKRFDVSSTGLLSVDTTFGHIGNGAIDQPFPDDACDAPPCSATARSTTALRTGTSAPTLYIAGDAPNAGTDINPFVMAIDGSSGDLAGTFGAGTGIYVQYEGQPNTSSSDHAAALVATTTGGPTDDVIYLAANIEMTCGTAATVTKLLASVNLPGGPFTLPDFSWAEGGTRSFGGDDSTTCTAGTRVTTARAMTIDGDRLAIAGTDRLFNIITPPRGPMLAIVRVSDGTLTDFADHLALHADGTPWGESTYEDVTAAGGGRFTVTGTIDDIDSAGGELFGTTRLRADRIFGDGFE